jgi:hypothetical protein
MNRAARFIVARVPARTEVTPVSAGAGEDTHAPSKAALDAPARAPRRDKKKRSDIAALLISDVYSERIAAKPNFA